MSASSPPTTRPTNWPAMAATMLMPIAMPRCVAGNASVRIAVALARSSAPPTPCTTRKPMSQIAPCEPVNGVSDSRIDARVKIRNPALYMRTRPYMSPRRPKVTTSTAVTTR